MKKGEIFLIVNADDFNLTRGVSEGILAAHEGGIVTSTSVLINLEIERSLARALMRRPRLGVGVHLNITLGKPVAAPRRIPSLLNPSGTFRRRGEIDLAGISAAQVEAEYEAQILRFRRVLGKWPTHLDTHHHLHEHRVVMRVLGALALRHGLPIRQSSLCGRAWRRRFLARGVRLTDSLWEDMEASRAWTAERLLKILRRIGAGAHELMCHPGKCDAELARISAFAKPREREWRALSSRRVRGLIRRRNIELINFSEMTT